MPREDWQVLTFERGLNSIDEASVFTDGECVSLQNYEWLPNGGITPRPAWKKAGASPTGGPAAGNRKGRGAFFDFYVSAARKILVAAHDGTNHVLYVANTSDPLTFASWSSVTSQAITGATNKGLPLSFAVGLNKVAISNPGLANGRVRYWDGAAVTTPATDNMAGRAIAFHLSRFFAFGPDATPTYLRWTEPGDETNWNVTENYAPISRDDGEPGEDIARYDRGLVLGKRHSLWYFAGDSTDTFDVLPLSRHIGCAPGRSLVSTPYGVFCVSTDGNVYLWAGGDVVPITETYQVPIWASGYVSAAYANDKLFIAGLSGTKVDVFDIRNKRWRREVHDSATDGPQDVVAIDNTYLASTPVDGSTSTILNVRLEQGAWDTAGYRDPGRDESFAEAYRAETKEFWPMGALGKATLRSVYLRYRQYGGGSSGAGLTVTPIVDGAALSGQAKTIPAVADGLYAKRLDYGASVNGRNFRLRFTSSPTNVQNDAYSIEECEANVLVDGGMRARQVAAARR